MNEERGQSLLARISTEMVRAQTHVARAGRLTRQCRLADRSTTQLFGPGDMIPMTGDDGSTPALEAALPGHSQPVKRTEHR